MYAQLTVVTACGQDELRSLLIDLVGVNSIAIAAGLVGTAFEHDPSAKSRVVAVEQIQNRARLVYFFEGSDTLSVHIAASTVGELKHQAMRVTRQLRRRVSRWKTFSAAASVLSQERPGADDLVIEGAYQPKATRLYGALARGLATKLTPPAVTFVATYSLIGATAITSVIIALLSATAGFGMDALIAATSAEEWKWEDAT